MKENMNEENIIWHIRQTTPFPFVKRWRVYSVDGLGDEYYVCTFRHRRDAENYADLGPYTLKRSKREIKEIKEDLMKSLNEHKHLLP